MKLQLIEQILGLGVIPPEWKQRIYGLLLAAVPIIELFWDIPEKWQGEALLMQVATAIAVVAAFALKLLRDRSKA